MNLSAKIDSNGYNNNIVEKNDDKRIGRIMSDDENERKDIIYNNEKNKRTSEIKVLKNDMDNNKNDNSIQSKLSFDIKNVLTHAYLPICLEKMKEGEYVYKWNNNIFQKKTLKFFYLDVNNYCIRWNSKKKKLSEKKNPSLYICDIIKILDGSESLFFKKKEDDKNLSIEIISTQRNLRLTFLDIQRWKMWLFGLMYYQYKLVNKGNGKKKMKSFLYESNKLYDNYIISGLKDINALTLSQLYIILRSLNIYLNMQILYHYFSIYKNKAVINYIGFTKILEHIFSNTHISIYFNEYKDKKFNYIDKKKFIEFLIDIQCEGKCEEFIFNNYYQNDTNPNLTREKNTEKLEREKKNDEDDTHYNLDMMQSSAHNNKIYNVNNQMDDISIKYKNEDDVKPKHIFNNDNKENCNKEENNYSKSENNTYFNNDNNNNNKVRNEAIINNYDCNIIKKISNQDINQDDIKYNMDISNTLIFSDNSIIHDEDYFLILDILKSKYFYHDQNKVGNKKNTHDNNYNNYNNNSANASCHHNLKDEKESKLNSNNNNNNNNNNNVDTCINVINKNIPNIYPIKVNVIYKLLNIIKKYNIPFVINNDDNQYLTEIGLVYFLLSKENSIMCPEYAKVYQNMNLPLCNYWINSSHNSYLARKQIFSTSNIEQYIYILLDGCRCVEFDCYYFNKNIVVYHGFYGYKLTSSILFCDTLIACKMFGFTTSPYPIILSLEIHCKNKHKNLIAKILISILGNQLYIPKTTDEINNITPNNCKNKFLVKYKHFENNDSSGFYYLFEGLQSVMYDELNYMSDILDENDELDYDNEDMDVLQQNCQGELLHNDDVDVENFDADEDEYEMEKTFGEYIEKSIEKKYNQDSINHKQLYMKNSDSNNNVSIEKENYEEKHNKFVEDTKKPRNILNIIKKNDNNMDNDSSDNNNSNNVKIPKNSITSCIEKKDKSKDLEEQKKKHILKKTDNFNLKNNNLLNEYSCLKGYVFRNFYETRNYNEICSISENKFIKLIKKNENEIIKYNQKTLTRVYPSGTRLASTNFNPLIFWNAGIQVVALNYQYNGLSMLLNKGRFLENGGKHSGYILKPELLRFNEKQDYNTLLLDLQILSLHQINLLFSIKNKYHEKKLKKKLFQMDMIQRIQTHKKIKKKIKNWKDLQKLEKEKKNILFSDVQSDDNKNKHISYELLLNKINDNDDVNYIHNKCLNVEKKYEDMLTEYKSFLLCSSSLSHSSSFNSCSSNTTTSNDGNKTHSNKNNSSKYKNKNFYQTFEELKKANNLFFYLYLTISIHGYNENKYYFKTEIAKVNFYDINYCWSKPSTFQMKISYPSLALIVFELKAYDTVKSEIIACACFPVKCLREGLRFVPLCDKYLKDIKGSGILVNLKINQEN
ncbi:hypothetical protein PFBG_02897 [Plasmodium falciparum 7G8]|uniref:Phosphoinositide phospholipase C n=1 Tax=Plasmodium falciparum (isolate 7G8) TaxID=57266 RepID=W7F787_PLAF8|nr:hypothetical protein PFBG_02897 [Plasmodium falciparum 7G8]